MELNKMFGVAIIFLFIYSQIGDGLPLQAKKKAPKYISPMENFYLMANKYVVHPEPDIANVTDQKSSDNISGKIAVQNLETNITKSDDVTTTLSSATTIV